MSDFSHDDRVRLAQDAMLALSDWGAPPEQQLALLGLPRQTRPRALKRYRDGTPLPESGETLERARHIVGIQESLERNHPRNRRAGFLWLYNKNKYFPENPPMGIMLDEGLPGLHRVWVNLDCTVGWD